MKIKSFTYQLNEIDTLAENLLQEFKHKVILFNGEMGAGKTTLIKALAKVMNSLDTVTSPTFSIVNEYKLSNDKIYHFDFYRIEDIEEAYNFGVEDYLYSKHWVFIEWSEKINSILPQNLCILDIDINNQTERTLKLTIKTNNLTENNAYEQLK